MQELLGGRLGEMSTLNYTFQSFNFRGKATARPFYDLVVNIAAEELEGFEAPDLPPQPAVFAPDYAPEEIAEIANRLKAAAGLPTTPVPSPSSGGLGDQATDAVRKAVS